jgi:hypothetical protein
MILFKKYSAPLAHLYQDQEMVELYVPTRQITTMDDYATMPKDWLPAKVHWVWNDSTLVDEFNDPVRVVDHVDFEYTGLDDVHNWISSRYRDMETFCSTVRKARTADES